MYRDPPFSKRCKLSMAGRWWVGAVMMFRGSVPHVDGFLMQMEYTVRWQ